MSDLRAKVEQTLIDMMHPKYPNQDRIAAAKMALEYIEKEEAAKSMRMETVFKNTKREKLLDELAKDAQDMDMY